MNYKLCIVNCLWAFRQAVGLSAISFSATLQKDAAPIPNAVFKSISQLLIVNCTLLIVNCQFIVSPISYKNSGAKSAPFSHSIVLNLRGLL